MALNRSRYRARCPLLRARCGRPSQVGFCPPERTFAKAQQGQGVAIKIRSGPQSHEGEDFRVRPAQLWYHRLPTHAQTLRRSRSGRQAVRRAARQRQAARRTVAVYGKAKPKIARVNILKGGNRAYPSGSIQSVGPGEGQSTKVPTRAVPAASLLVNFLFWRGAGSGCTLFPSPHGIVAVIGDENAGRAPANPQADGAVYARASPFHTNYFP
jgi:hypothetical protein